MGVISERSQNKIYLKFVRNYEITFLLTFFYCCFCCCGGGSIGCCCSSSSSSPSAPSASASPSTFFLKFSLNQTVINFSAFTAEQLVNAVQIATQFAMWIGCLSLLVEILGVIIR